MSRTTITVNCHFCNNEFQRFPSTVKRNKLEGTNMYCSMKCSGLNQSSIYRVTKTCAYCNKTITTTKYRQKISKNNFCSKSCLSKYNHSNKTTGTVVSKLEKWIQTKLIELYPNLNFVFNGKETINSELDIYIPSLKLAFELNGIFHYEPIYGEDKLSKIQNNDHRKFKACGEFKISLCIIDTTKQKYFKESTSTEYLEIITKIINSKNKP